MPYYVDGDEHTRELRAALADADSQGEANVWLLADLRAERATVAALERTVERLMVEATEKQRRLDELMSRLEALDAIAGGE